jgi:hypothetical protein
MLIQLNAQFRHGFVLDGNFNGAFGAERIKICEIDGGQGNLNS